MRCSRSPSGSARGPRHRPLRARARRPAARGRRSRQGSELLARCARSRLARQTALPARRAAQGRGPRSRTPARSTGREQAETRRTCAFSPLGGAASSPSRAARRAGGSVARRRRCGRRKPSRRAPLHRWTAPRHRVGGGTPLYVLATDADANTVTVGPRERATRTVPVRDAVCIGRSSTACGCATASGRCVARACASVREGGAKFALELDEPAYGVAPGQLACLMDGDVVVGHATIAR